MPIAVTLIAAKSDKNFSSFADDCAAELARRGFPVAERAELCPHQAHDLLLETDAETAVRDIVDGLIADRPVDALVQDASRRRKRFLVADMESTIIEQEMLDEMADAIGCRAHVAEITRRAMNGEIDFSAAIRERVALFAGQPAALLEQMAERITIMPGARALVTTMRRHGGTCWLVSGGFRCFTGLIASRLGFDAHFGNDLEIEDGKITGKVAEPILDKNAKLLLYRQGMEQLGIAPGEAITVGDGANDLPMIEACAADGGLGIAFHAKPAVAAKAAHRVAHGDLTALLYAQGYRVEEFAQEFAAK
ncbi:MAG: phosphoserine phosphatase SerB [Alphaproteobacteria bacterium]